MRIDPRDYQAKVDLAKAALEQAESQLRAARVVVPWTDETTQSGASASAQLADAKRSWSARAWLTSRPPARIWRTPRPTCALKQASNDRAQADLARMKPLVDKAEISQLQYDAYVAAARRWRRAS